MPQGRLGKEIQDENQNFARHLSLQVGGSRLRKPEGFVSFREWSLVHASFRASTPPTFLVALGGLVMGMDRIYRPGEDGRLRVVVREDGTPQPGSFPRTSFGHRGLVAENTRCLI